MTAPQPDPQSGPPPCPKSNLGQDRTSGPLHAPWPARRETLIGIALLVVLIAGFGGWATLSTITGAVIAQGRVEVAQNRQVVQHPEGGVVADIVVAEGDSVRAGQVLIRLDPAPLRAQRAIVDARLAGALALRARLEAEHAGSHSGASVGASTGAARIAADFADLAGMAQLAPLQALLLDARRGARQGARAQLQSQRRQIDQELVGLAAQHRALAVQSALIDAEITAQQVLRDKGLTQESRLLALRREAARLAGALGEVTAQTAHAEARAADTALEQARRDAAHHEEVASALADIAAQEVELRAQRAALTDRLAALDIRAPVSGIVHGLEVFAPRAVLGPAQPLLHIVPQDGPVIVTARLRSVDGALVHPGQRVTLRLTALDRRSTPEAGGTIARVSPDTFMDDATRRSFYALRITPDQGGAEGASTALRPGMPVEILIRTGERTPLSLLTKPLTDYFTRALRG